ncbi:unnamed protein product [Heligmosomoides polygyrus]|uniref:LETM1 domain-containing protein n=1 Tax=Heligmosomoides polygyrus TaxID=6339 RepID=A0A183GTJ7_HELPZ|nr:unnamed protein product [Heligmosomoides polygyrus]
MKRCAIAATSTVASSATCPMGSSSSSTVVDSAAQPRPFKEIPGPNTFSRLFGRNRYLPFTNEVANALVKHIKDESEKSRSGEVDLRSIAGRWALEAAALTTFEKRIGALAERVEWADQLVNLNRSIFKLSAILKFAFPLYRYVWTPKWKKMVDLEDRFYREADSLIDEAIDKLHGSTQSEEEMKFASLLINRKELNVKDVKIILLSMFSDGLSTVSESWSNRMLKDFHFFRAGELVANVPGKGKTLTSVGHHKSSSNNRHHFHVELDIFHVKLDTLLGLSL